MTITDSDSVLVLDSAGSSVGDSTPAASPMVASWYRLWAAQGRRIGLDVMADLGEYGGGKAIISSVVVDPSFISGGIAEAGGWNIQIPIRELIGEPAKKSRITCNGEAEGKDLRVDNVERNNGIFYILAVDFAASNR
jgi:hypothetical protein